MAVVMAAIVGRAFGRLINTTTIEEPIGADRADAIAEQSWIEVPDREEVVPAGFPNRTYEWVDGGIDQVELEIGAW